MILYQILISPILLQFKARDPEWARRVEWIESMYSPGCKQQHPRSTSTSNINGFSSCN